MQFPMFILLFLTPVYVPQDLLAGWIAHVASVNPLTLVLNTNRDLLAGLSAQIALTWALVLGLIALLSAWSVSGMRKAEAAG
jgi:ABC-2 type transport system permease protein